MGRNRVFTGKEAHIRRIRFGMLARCYSPKSESYKFYGGKGICVCDEWKNDANSFCEWALSNGYSEDLVIDRIDSSKNYEPSNCRWITRSENTRLATTKPKITYSLFRGKVAEQKKLRKLTNADLAKMTGYSKKTIESFMCGARESERIAKAIAAALDIEL